MFFNHTGHFALPDRQGFASSQLSGAQLHVHFAQRVQALAVDKFQQATHPGGCAGGEALDDLAVAHHHQFHRTKANRDYADFAVESTLALGDEIAFTIEQVVKQPTGHLAGCFDIGDLHTVRFTIRRPGVRAAQPAFDVFDILLGQVAGQNFIGQADNHGKRGAELTIALLVAGQRAVQQRLHFRRAIKTVHVQVLDRAAKIVSA